MIYKLNNRQIDVESQIEIEGVNYPPRWFLDVNERIKYGITEEPNPPPTNEELAIITAHHIDLMWQAAHKYETDKLQGSAVGLVTIGIMMQKPKCTAVQNWVKSIWQLYYSRKASVSAVYQEALNDFSSCGPMPYSISELMIELGM